MSWTCADCSLAVETVLKTGESLIAMQRVFYAHLTLCQNDTVLDRIFNQLQHRFSIYRLKRTAQSHQHQQSATQGQFLSENQQVWIQIFPSSGLVAIPKLPSLPYYLPIAKERIFGLVSFPRVLALWEMLTAFFRIWTWVAMSILNKSNQYSISNSFLNEWNHTTVQKLFVVNKNTLYQITMGKINLLTKQQ